MTYEFIPVPQFKLGHAVNSAAPGTTHEARLARPYPNSLSGLPEDCLRKVPAPVNY